jgi:hypothetical protein
MEFLMEKSRALLPFGQSPTVNPRLSISIQFRKYFPDKKREKIRTAKDAIAWFFRKVKNERRSWTL